MRSNPPRLGDALLRLVLSGDDAETVAGDLEEMFHDVSARRGRAAAALWHWRQVLSICRAHLFDSRNDTAPAPRRRPAMAALRQDVLYAMRSLRKQPGFTATVVLMLALGVGANVAIFSLINAVMLRPLPFAEPDRLMLAHLLAPQREAPGTFRHGVWSYPKYQVFQQNQRVYESTAAFGSTTWNVTGSGSPERIFGELVEATYFDVLRLTPAAGRVFSVDETRTPGSAPTLAVLGHGFWTRRFGADPSVVGRTVGLNGIPHTIVGVLPAGFRGLTGQAEVWVPLMTVPAERLAWRFGHSYFVVARRRPDISADQAQAAVRVLGGVIDEQHRDPFGDGSAWSATAVSLNDERVDPLIRRSMLIMIGAVASVLLIVCINVANLMLTRTLGRQREVSIRLALGASRSRIVRQFMTESLLLASAGAIAGLLVAYTLVAAGASLMPNLQTVLTGDPATRGLTRVSLGLLGVDATVLLYAIGIASLTAVLFGLGPALRGSRHDLTAAMKSGSSGSVSRGTRAFGLRSLLVVGEIAIALVLLAAGGLMVKSVARLQATELGFNPSSLLTVRMILPAPKYTPESATQVLDQLLERLAGRPDVESVAFGNCAPVSGGCSSTSAMFRDRPPVVRGTEPLVGVFWASPRYFDTLGIRLIRGRVFTAHDRVGQPRVVVINETAARQLWGAADPIGKRIAVGQGGFHTGDGAEVVGIVADVRYGEVERSMRSDVYLPLLQSPQSGGLIFIRSRAAASSLVPVVRREVQALDADLPLVDIKMMDERFGDATWRTRMSAWLLGAFAALALLLAALGVHGVMSQGVQQRTREIGLRIALGAARGDILRLIIGRVIGIGVAGIAIGVLLAIPSTRLLTAMLYQVTPGDPAVFATLALMLLAVALIAGYMPARRATRVDPLTTLRSE